MQSYFELLGLAPDFTLDEKALDKAYFAAQRAAHPDKFIGKPEADRVAAITRSQLVNDAFETLKNPLTRAEHLLLLNGYSALDEDAAPPPDLLMEVMELREQIADAAEQGPALAAQITDIKARHAQNIAALESAFAAADYAQAAKETMRLQYLGKAMEEAHMLIYRLKASHG